jgi:hypothetical protein
MGSSGAIELADLEGKLTALELRCTLCQRFGRYNLAALIKRFGRKESVLNVRTGLTTGCPKQRHFDVHDLCQAQWSDDMLVALYGEERARELVRWRETRKQPRRE